MDVLWPVRVSEGWGFEWRLWEVLYPVLGGRCSSSGVQESAKGCLQYFPDLSDGVHVCGAEGLTCCFAGLAMLVGLAGA